MNTVQALRSFRGKSFDEVISSLEDEVLSFSTHTPRSRDIFLANLMRYLDSPSFQGKNLSDSSWQKFDDALSRLLSKESVSESSRQHDLVKLVHTVQKITKRANTKLSQELCPVVVFMHTKVIEKELAQETGGLDDNDEASQKIKPSQVSLRGEVVLPKSWIAKRAGSRLFSKIQEGQLDLSELHTEKAFRFVVAYLKDNKFLETVDFKYVLPFAYKYNCSQLYNHLFDFMEQNIKEFSKKPAKELTKVELEIIDCIIETLALYNGHHDHFFRKCLLIRLDTINKDELKRYIEQLLSRIASTEEKNSQYSRYLCDALAEKIKKVPAQDQDGLFKALFDPKAKTILLDEDAALAQTRKQFQDCLLEVYIETRSGVRVECNLEREILVLPALLNVECVQEFEKLAKEMKLSQYFPKVIFCVALSKYAPTDGEFFKENFRKFMREVFFRGSEKSNYAFWPKTIDFRILKDSLWGDQNDCLEIQNAAKSAISSLLDECQGLKEAMSDITIQVEARLFIKRDWVMKEVKHPGGAVVV